MGKPKNVFLGPLEPPKPLERFFLIFPRNFDVFGGFLKFFSRFPAFWPKRAKRKPRVRGGPKNWRFGPILVGNCRIRLNRALLFFSKSYRSQEARLGFAT